MTLGEKIKTLRKKNKISQERLAELLGVSRQAVSKWEIGSSTPSTENLFHIAEIFHVSIEEMINLEKTPNRNKRILLVNISLIGYIAIMVSAVGLYGYYFPYQDAHLYQWIIWGVLGGGLLGYKNLKIYRSTKKYLWDTPFTVIIYILPNILLSFGMSNSLSILITITVGIIFALVLVNAVFHPWKKAQN